MAETDENRDKGAASTPGQRDEDIRNTSYESAGAVTRRRFLTATFVGATAIGLGALAAPLARYAYPIIKPEVFERRQVTTLDNLTPLGAGINFEYQEIPAQLIMLADGTPAAYSLICPHLGCIVKWVVRDGLFECPCHAAKFEPNGDVASGPPPRPLTRLITVVEGDTVFVEGVELEEIE